MSGHIYLFQNAGLIFKVYTYSYTPACNSDQKCKNKCKP